MYQRAMASLAVCIAADASESSRELATLPAVAVAGIASVAFSAKNGVSRTGLTCVAQVTTTAYDGNPVFFPIDPVNYTPSGPNHTAAGALLNA